MDKTLEEMRAETDRYIKNIVALCEKINYDINCINTNLRMVKDIMTEEQLIESKPDMVKGETIQ